MRWRPTNQSGPARIAPANKVAGRQRRAGIGDEGAPDLAFYLAAHVVTISRAASSTKRAKLRRWTARSKFQNGHPHPPRYALLGPIELGTLGPSGTLTPFSSNLGVGFL